MLGGVRQGAYDFYDVIASLAKIIVFCGELKSSIELSLEEIDSTISSGIAKKTIV